MYHPQFVLLSGGGSQTDGTWISEEMFAELTAQVRDAIARLEAAGKPVPHSL